MLNFKRLSFLALATLLMLAVLTSCLADTTTIPPADSASSESASAAETSNNQQTASSESQPVYTLSDYLPSLPNLFCDYGGTGNEYVPMQVWVEYLGPGFVQLSEDNGGTQIHKLYRLRDGQILLTVTVPELYVREDLRLYPESEKPEVLLQEPLEAGTSWLVDGHQRLISAVDVPVTTTAGTFQTIEVTTEGDGVLTRRYYAPGIGLVRMTTEGDYQIDQWLNAYTNDKPRQIDLAFYYGRLTETDSEIVSQTLPIDLPTNVGLIDVLNRYFREPAIEGMPPLMSQNATIQSIRLDPQSGVVNIDFSIEFVTEMNAGSAFEAVIIQSVVNTVGKAYGAEKVFISLNGKPYESGHIALGPGEYFGVDEERVRFLQ